MFQETQIIILTHNDWEFLNDVAKLEEDAFGTAGLNTSQLAFITHAGKIYGLIVEKQLIGEAILIPSWKHYTVFLFSFVIKSGFRRLGFGKKFLKEILIDLTKERFIYLELTVSPENLPAQKLYFGCGFEEIAYIENAAGPNQPRKLLRKILSNN